MSGFNSPITGDFDKYFMTTTDLIDRYATGGLWSCGYNSDGQLGDNTQTRKSSPVQTITRGTTWKQVACGYYSTAAIKTDGTLWTWGKNTNGVLGNNTSGSANNKSSPIQTISGGTNWKQVFPNDRHVSAIKNDGTLWLWGDNTYGQLGDNTTAHKSSPVQTITFATDWKQAACGYYHTAAIKTDGTLWTWGLNGDGQLGDNKSGSANNKSSPIQTITGGSNWKQVSAGGGHTAAIKTDGTLWLWGRNNLGQLGDNTIASKSSPIQTITGGTTWKQVSCGRGLNNYTAAIKTDGTLWLWGNNSFGQLGDNTIASKSSPIQTISGGSNWKQVSSAFFHTVAIKTDGTLWGWGQNGNGQLGDNSLVNRSSPVQTISNGSNWKQVDCGLLHTAAVQYSDIGQVL